MVLHILPYPGSLFRSLTSWTFPDFSPTLSGVGEALEVRHQGAPVPGSPSSSSRSMVDLGAPAKLGDDLLAVGWGASMASAGRLKLVAKIRWCTGAKWRGFPCVSGRLRRIHRTKAVGYVAAQNLLDFNPTVQVIHKMKLNNKKILGTILLG